MRQTPYTHSPSCLGAALAGILLALSMGGRSLQAADALPFPSEPDNSTLFQQFPVAPSNLQDESQLSHYLAQLEEYRQGVLEAFNSDIESFAQDLATFSLKLERIHASHAISDDEYNQLNSRHDTALAECSPKGKLIKIYVLYLQKYEGETRWTIRQLRELHT